MNSTDIILVLGIFFIFILCFALNLLISSMQEIKDNWPVYRCHPTVMPFAGVFGHNTGENFSFCISQLASSNMSSYLTPTANIAQGHSSNMSGITKAVGGTMSGLSSSNSNMAGLGSFNLGVFGNINTTIEEITERAKSMGVIGKSIIEMPGDMLAGGTNVFKNIWNGLPGKLIRAL